jgi:hypothetical protein
MFNTATFPVWFRLRRVRRLQTQSAGAGSRTVIASAVLGADDLGQIRNSAVKKAYHVNANSAATASACNNRRAIVVGQLTRLRLGIVS